MYSHRDHTRYNSSMTKYLGIIGYPLGHSISPVFQQAALDYLGIDARYLLWPTQPSRLSEQMRLLSNGEVLGANVTVPYKEAVIPYLDTISDLARRVAAVNTLVNRNGVLHGYNTDVAGFMRAMEDDGKFDPAGKRALIIGAGGASKAVALALLDANIASLTVANRTLSRAEALVESLPGDMNANARPLTEATLETSDGWDLVINTTSVGMAGGDAEGQSPIPAHLIPRDALIVDIVYNPTDTPLLRAAQRKGAPILGGLPMLVYQGAEAFRLWTGQEAPTEIMFNVATRALAVH